MRPEFYSKFDLPGHEGVDIRAPSGSNIYACATGVVKLVAVNWRPGQAGRTAMHPYGYHVRLRHKRMDGEYETIYAHLTEGSAKVKEGEHVMAGQLIALADNTGNSSANHLHLSLKKIKPAGKKAAEPPAGLKLNQYILMGDGNILIDPALYLPAG
jgi:murein DD-endopeptidase MepM/ murein hydrolase activator NlpD